MSIDFDRMREIATETAASRKRRLWDKRKAELRALQPTGGVRSAIGRRKKIPCTCGHTMKHHTKTGRCRGKMPSVGLSGEPDIIAGRVVLTGCNCQAGVRAPT